MPHLPSVGFGAGAGCAALAAVLLALGCGHTEPFTSPPYGSDVPFDPSPPARLTYNTAADRAPFWLAEDAGLLYSTQQLDRADQDVCAALLPAFGGTQRELWCDVPTGPNATDAIETPAIGPDGRLGFVSATGTVGTTNPLLEGIAVASTLDPRDARMVRMFPYTPDGSTPQNSAQYLRWLDPTRLVYVGQNAFVRSLCPLCPPDTLRTGEAVTVLEVDVSGAPPIAIPGTAGATGLAVEPGGAALLYTLAGDSRVYRHSLADGTVQVVHDFGLAGIARDLDLVGRRMAAIVGGRVTFSTDPVFGAVQYDSGGVVHVVDLDSGTDVVLPSAERFFRRPAISPDGARLAAEGYPADLFFGRDSDLYLFGTP